MQATQTLPKKGDKVYAWVPKLHKEVAATVEAVRGSKLTVTVYTGDNGLEKFTGIAKWKPAEKNGKLKGEQLPLPVDVVTTVVTTEEVPAETEAEPIAKRDASLSQNFDPLNQTIEINIADIWPTEKEFDENTDEAIALQPRNKIDPDTVNRYVEIFDALPAIDVFKVHGQTGFCLAGGWHRRAAAVKLGRTEIKANVHVGTIEEAILFAATDNLTSGLQLDKSGSRGSV